MYKELIIILSVIALIVGLDIASNHYTQDSVTILSKELNELRKDILQKDKVAGQQKMEKIKEEWKERYNVLAYYIEHDELEKVETQLVGVAAYLNMEEYTDCISDLDTTIFILEHIEEKTKFDVRSIF